MNPTLGRWLGGGVVLLVALDWFSKLWVNTRMALNESMMLIDGWFYFVHRKNTGAAFSLFADLPDLWRVPLLTIASVVGVVLFWRIIQTTQDLFVRVTAAAVMAGAIGNLGDRVVNGHVTDFLLVRYFPFVFNVADVAITVGGVLLAVRLFTTESALEPAPVTEPR
jgi:signal peptidase II